MSLQIEGAAMQHLTPFERNKYARGLDYVGYVPGLGSVGGVARLIAGIAAMIFFSMEGSKAEEGTDKQKLLMYRTVAGHEALRGLLEITWIFNLIIGLALESQVDSHFGSDRPREYRLSDVAYEEFQRKNEPIAGYISVDSYIAHGKYIYKDNNSRFNAIHYSRKRYTNNQVIWATVLPTRRDDLGPYGTYGTVLKEGHTAQKTAPATFTVQRS